MSPSFSWSPKSKTAAIVLAGVVTVGAAFYGLPCLWAQSVPGYLNKNIGPYLVVDHATFKHFPPRLILSDVHLKNAKQFGDGDAVHIDHINVLFADYKRHPYAIRNITVSGVQGRLIIRGQEDNMATIFGDLMAKKRQVPEGHLANQALLGKVYIERSVATNEQQTVTLPLEDVEFEPKGELRQGGSIQHVITDVLGAVVQQQAEAGPGLVVKNLKEKAKETLRSISDSLQKMME